MKLGTRNIASFTEEDVEKVGEMMYKNMTFGVAPKKQPSIYIIGGLPGAGKTEFVNTIIHQLTPIDINGDKYRQYHPHYQEIINKYGTSSRYTAATQKFANAVCDYLRVKCFQNHYSFSIEGTMTNPDVVIKTSKEARSYGYQIGIYGIISDASVCWSKSTERYRQECDEGVNGARQLDAKLFNASVEKIPSSLAKIQQCAEYDKLGLMDSQWTEYYSLPYKEGTAHGVTIEQAAKYMLCPELWSVMYTGLKVVSKSKDETMLMDRSIIQ